MGAQGRRVNVPPDVDAERCALAWVAEDGGARALLFGELDRRDFWEPSHRDLFVALRDLHQADRLVHGYEIRGLDVVHVWHGLSEPRRAELTAIVESGDVPIYFPSRGRAVVERLTRLTRDRLLLATAEAVGRGEEVPDGIVRFVLEGRA